MTTSSISTELVKKAISDAQTAKKVGAEDLVVLGGVFNDKQGPAFLNVWGDLLVTLLPWRMYEYTGRFCVQKADTRNIALPDSWFFLERARFFGLQGDLDLRRDIGQFRWRFIGEKTAGWPNIPDIFPLFDFWKVSTPPTPVFYEIAQNYYQWRLQDQRVTNHWSANTGLPAEGVYLKQKHYLENGRIAFVRYLEFSTAEGKDGRG